MVVQQGVARRCRERRRQSAEGGPPPVGALVVIGEDYQVGQSSTRRVNMDVTVTPIGRPADSDMFHRRAGAVVERLRSYLLAD